MRALLMKIRLPMQLMETEMLMVLICLKYWTVVLTHNLNVHIMYSVHICLYNIYFNINEAYIYVLII